MVSEDLILQQPARPIDITKVPDPITFPLLVCGICQRWKVLALSTPELWSFIIPPLHRLRTAQSSERWTSQWLSRSGVLAVSVVIDDRLRTKRSRNHTVEESQEVILGVLRGIGRHSYRLRRLDIWSQHVYPNDLKTLFQHAEEPIQLRQLSLCCGRITQTQIIPNSSPQTAVIFSWLERLPRLHKLRLAGAIFPVVSPLTSLSIHGLCARYSEIQTIFATCPNIKSLAFPGLLPLALPLSTPSAPITATSPVSVLHMPNLEHLEIDGDTEISWAFDSSLASSKVQKLRLSNRPKGLSRDDQLLVRSWNRLRSLQLLETSTEGLFLEAIPSPSMDRTRSISSLFSFSSSSSSSSSSSGTTPRYEVWPDLTDITLSTIVVEDVMRLCRFVNLHRGIRTIRLSRHTRRHLSSKGIEEVSDWLNKLVDVKVFKTSPGVLDCEQFPLQELLDSFPE